MRPSCWSSRQASVGATAIVHLNLPISLPNSRPSCSSMSGAASPPAPQRSQARTYPIASASRIVRPNPKVRLCADSSSVRMKAAGGVPLRRDAPCPNTGPPVNLEFGTMPLGLDQSVGSIGSHTTKTRIGSDPNRFRSSSTAEDPRKQVGQVGESSRTKRKSFDA
jgi:hypothetical protein